LGKQDIDFDKPIIAISSNPHLSSLARAAAAAYRVGEQGEA
jgi:hypothetical protein